MNKSNKLFSELSYWQRFEIVNRKSILIKTITFLRNKRKKKQNE